MYECTIKNNVSLSLNIGSGGLFHADSSYQVGGTRFISNTGHGVGALQIVSGSGIVEGCEFIHNKSRRAGAVRSQVPMEIINSGFYQNTSESVGSIFGTIYLAGDNNQSEIINCSFNTNESPRVVVVPSLSSSPIIENSIFWGIGTGTFIGNPIVQNCIVQGGYAGGTNIITDDPKFAFPDSSLLSLKSCSPAIDIGDNSVNSTTKDILGNTRFYDASSMPPATIDLGAYEFIGEQTLTCCESALMLSGNLTDPLYEAGATIVSDGTVSGGGPVIFSAPESVELQPFFEVQQPTSFTILLTGCTE